MNRRTALKSIAALPMLAAGHASTHTLTRATGCLTFPYIVSTAPIILRFIVNGKSSFRFLNENEAISLEPYISQDGTVCYEVVDPSDYRRYLAARIGRKNWGHRL